MKKSALIFGLLAFLVAGTASATVTLLTGGIHYINPGANWKAEHTVEYNAIFNNMTQCENARNLIEASSPRAMPGREGQAPLFGQFSKVSTLVCTYK